MHAGNLDITSLDIALHCLSSSKRLPAIAHPFATKYTISSITTFFFKFDFKIMWNICKSNIGGWGDLKPFLQISCWHNKEICQRRFIMNWFSFFDKIWITPTLLKSNVTYKHKHKTFCILKQGRMERRWEGWAAGVLGVSAVLWITCQSSLIWRVTNNPRNPQPHPTPRYIYTRLPPPARRV